MTIAGPSISSHGHGSRYHGRALAFMASRSWQEEARLLAHRDLVVILGPDFEEDLVRTLLADPGLDPRRQRKVVDDAAGTSTLRSPTISIPSMPLTLIE
jgi:hypothetical protein